MKKNLRITLVQPDVFWHEKEKNFRQFEQIFQNIQSDLVLLPEMFNTGFTIEPVSVAEDMNGPTVQWLIQQAQQHDFNIIGSIIIREQGKFYNRLLWVSPTGKIVYYDKRHTFTMAGEDRYFAKGNRNVLIHYQDWRIKPLICYDLRFPVWARNRQDYHLLIYVANWPESRIEQWESLLRARAIENQTFVAAVNRIGQDGNGFVYSGRSMIVSPKGEFIYKSPDNKVDVHTEVLNLDVVLKAREKFPVLKDQDKFTIYDEQLVDVFV